jgi:hypothetical protein
MSDQPPINPNQLRIIRTARTEKAINKAAREGFRPLVKPVTPGEQIHYMVAVFQHKQTGEIQLSGDCRNRPDADQEMVMPYRTYYPYHFPSPYAAYLIPADLAAGDRIWLEDVIEDIVAVWGNQGYQPRLKHAEATWTGKDFTIHFDPATDAPEYIG